MDWATISITFKDDSKTLDDKVSDVMVMEVRGIVCEFSRLVNQNNQSNVSIIVLNNKLKLFYTKRGNFVAQ